MANKLRLLRLAPEVLTLLRDSGCTERHARALLRLEDGALQWTAAQTIVRDGLTVARTEQLVERLLSRGGASAPRRPTFVIKDIRFFLNTITRGVSLMRTAGVDAACDRQETADTILLTIRIPKQARA